METTDPRDGPATATERSAVAEAPVLDVENIEVVYNDVVLVLQGVSLAVPRGRIVALLGGNGAGKSTTLKAISGLLATEDGAVTRGSIRFEGSVVNGERPDAIVRRGVFQVMEGRRIIDDMTVRENLRMGGYSRPRDPGRDEYDLVYGYFPRLKERASGLAGYLSGGEQQMLAIGRALMARPRLILLDEPSMGLSPMMVQEVFEIIARINREQGISILLVEQNSRMALGVADRGYIMENGKIVLEGSAQELRDNEDVREFYLGQGDQQRNFKNLKSYRRRKRWL